MAELNLNYDLPWMQQKPDSNQPMSLAEAFQLKQRQQQIDTEKALLPLRQQEMQAQVANAALDHQIKQEQVATVLKFKQGDARAWEQIANITDPSDPKQWQPVYKIWSETGAANPATVKAAEQIQQNAQMFKSKLDKDIPAVEAIKTATAWENNAKQLEAAGFQAEAQQMRDKAKTLLGTLKTPANEDTPQEKNANMLLDADKKVIAASGSPPMTSLEQATKFREYAGLMTEKPGQETTIEQGPDGHFKIRVRSGVGKEGPTIAAEGKAQMDIMGLRQSVQQLENMTAALRPEDVGIAGKVGDLTMRWVKQLAPAIGDSEVISNRVQAEGALNRYLETQMKLGRASRAEIERMRNALFDPQKMGQSYDQTMAAANKMKTMQRMDMITTAKSVSPAVPLTEDMFVGLVYDDYQDLILSKILTKEEALKWARQVNPSPP